jgi:hypothetical protein
VPGSGAAAWGHAPGRPGRHYIRDRLATVLDASASERDQWATPTGWPDGPSPLIAILGGWGPAAEPALDVLVDALPVAPYAVPMALAAIGPAARDAEAALRTATAFPRYAQPTPCTGCVRSPHRSLRWPPGSWTAAIGSPTGI